MKKEIVNIAIDGPSSSGKSTVADIVANKLNILHLDTGAMYRAVALKANKLNVSPNDENGVAKFIDDVDLNILFKDGKQVTYLDGENVSEKIRQPHISMMASDISKLGCVRKKLVKMQQELAKKMPCVLDGRDIGTHVLVDAPYKFFMTAQPEIRANRRYLELKNKGFNVDYNNILEEIKQRDYNDTHRAISPLKQAKDAIVIDTSDMSPEDVANAILLVVEGK